MTRLILTASLALAACAAPEVMPGADGALEADARLVEDAASLPPTLDGALSCPAATDCEGRACGLDPVCGLSCGACPSRHRCDEGRCLCEPDCAGRVCGDDACGGLCGACDDGAFCGNDGLCYFRNPDCDIDPSLVACEGLDCGLDPVCAQLCGICAPNEACRDGHCVCVPLCDGLACGGDGCGGVCGQCGPGEICEAGACGPPPVICPEAADCGAQLCGHDPICGEPCGACQAHESCLQGVCVCVGSCEGRACGDDGCGVPCGICPAGQVCDAGRCADPPAQCPETMDCAGRVCGADPICGQPCGECAVNQLCRDGACHCLPQCAGRECGPDGCGGACDVCGGGEVCQVDSGRCVCAPSCVGRQCGGDGCGGNCGGCAPGTMCNEGRCVCAPSCLNRACGDDGCGGSCGDCAPGLRCEAGRCLCPTLTCGEACCAQGQACEAGRCCARSWRVRFANTFYRDISWINGRLYLSGREGVRSLPRYSRIDVCDGQRLTDSVLEHELAAHNAVAGALIPLPGGDLLTVGSFGETANGSAYWARLNPDTLRQVWMGGLWAGQRPELWDLALDPAGRVWMSGTSGVDPAAYAPQIWAITGREETRQACGWNGSTGTSGLGRRLLAQAGWVYLGGSKGNQLVAQGYLAGNCPEGVAPCACPVAFEAYPNPAPPGYSEARALVMGWGQLIAVGFAIQEDQGQGRVYAFNPATGAQTSAFAWDPSPARDLLFGADMIANQSILAAGIENFNEDRARSWARVIAISAEAQLTRVVDLGPGYAYDVKALGDGTMIVLVDAPGGAEVVRCPVEGPCPLSP
ncbi:hypothetical protein KKF91_11740 [Myxococcota bacterium]|nr:hypothetical protein [Myxococcota bacterium]